MDIKSRQIVTSELLKKTVEANKQGKTKERMMDMYDLLAIFMRGYQLSAFYHLCEGSGHCDGKGEQWE